MKNKPILCLDFDGVIHSYTSGWKGARKIPDEPMTGALEFLVGALDHFDVAIFSSRSHQFGGRRAMKRWLYGHLYRLGVDHGESPRWWTNRIARTAFADPWPDEVDWAAKGVIRQIKWPVHKPPAILTIDDRAVQFKGEWPTLFAMQNFKPWKPQKPATASIPVGR